MSSKTGQLKQGMQRVSEHFIRLFSKVTENTEYDGKKTYFSAMDDWQMSDYIQMWSEWSGLVYKIVIIIFWGSVSQIWSPQGNDLFNWIKMVWTAWFHFVWIIFGNHLWYCLQMGNVSLCMKSGKHGSLLHINHSMDVHHKDASSGGSFKLESF